MPERTPAPRRANDNFCFCCILFQTSNLCLSYCSKYVGTFQLHVDESGDAIANNDAAIFVSTNPKPKLYVYR